MTRNKPRIPVRTNLSDAALATVIGGGLASLPIGSALERRDSQTIYFSGSTSSENT